MMYSHEHKWGKPVTLASFDEPQGYGTPAHEVLLGGNCYLSIRHNDKFETWKCDKVAAIGEAGVKVVKQP